MKRRWYFKHGDWPDPALFVIHFPSIKGGIFFLDIWHFRIWSDTWRYE